MTCRTRGAVSQSLAWVSTPQNALRERRTLARGAVLHRKFTWSGLYGAPMSSAKRKSAPEAAPGAVGQRSIARCVRCRSPPCASNTNQLTRCPPLSLVVPRAASSRPSQAATSLAHQHRVLALAGRPTRPRRPRHVRPSQNTNPVFPPRLAPLLLYPCATLACSCHHLSAVCMLHPLCCARDVCKPDARLRCGFTKKLHPQCRCLSNLQSSPRRATTAASTVVECLPRQAVPCRAPRRCRVSARP